MLFRGWIGPWRSGSSAGVTGMIRKLEHSRPGRLVRLFAQLQCLLLLGLVNYWVAGGAYFLRAEIIDIL